MGRTEVPPSVTLTLMQLDSGSPRTRVQKGREPEHLPWSRALCLGRTDRHEHWGNFQLGLKGGITVCELTKK